MTCTKTQSFNSAAQKSSQSQHRNLKGCPPLLLLLVNVLLPPAVQCGSWLVGRGRLFVHLRHQQLPSNQECSGFAPQDAPVACKRVQA